MENDISSQPDLLGDIEQVYEYEDASIGQRLANYLIDCALFILLCIAFVVITIFATRSYAIIEWLDSLPVLVDRLMWLVIFAIFMSLVEGFSKGRSLGKLITGTMAVRWDHQPFSWSDAFARSFSRIVPFEPLSTLWGNPWHDQWTDTRVVKISR